MNVTLLSGSDRKHYQQLYTGFAMLARQGAIRLRTNVTGAHLCAIANGKVLAYDIKDNHRVDQALLPDCDFYFKRSYYPPYVGRLTQRQKVLPLGLNYEVYPDFIDWHALKRSLLGKQSLRPKLRDALRSLRLDHTFRPRLSQMEAHEAPCVDPARVLFLAQAWDRSKQGDPPDLRPDGMPSRDDINDMRAACIVALRREFGSRALTGFVRTPFAERKYASLLAPDVTKKAKYVATLQQYPICVATTGLHGSVGGKFAEYVAFGKAIVSERLYFEAPGLQVGVHYLDFTTVGGLVDNVSRLFADPDLRRRIAESNLLYYKEYLRPDRLVMRTLRHAA